MKYATDWEWVIDNIYRIKTPKGWLLKIDKAHSFNEVIHLIYVPDEKHEWNLEGEDE